jgi:aspartate racemase
MARIWSEVLGVERVGVLDNFFDLGGHSLLAIQLLGRIEKELGPRLSLAAIFRSPRIADLAEIFEERRRRARTVTPSLVPIQRKGSHPPFYCVHAETGVVYYRPLARLVGADQPFYGIQSRGLDGRGRPLETVEEMAAHYVAEVRGFQPEGPYYIGGHSFGGKIAFEMARQLAAAGQRTAFLALFDTATSPSRPLSARTSMFDLVRSRARIHVQILESLGSREKASYLIQRWETVQSVFSHWFARATDGLFHPLRHAQRMVREANICAAARYVPKYYEGRVTIFRATDRGVQLIDPDLGWRELCREGVEVHEVPGGHSSILLEDVHLQALGAKLRECLRDARKTERLKSISMGRGTAAER